MSSNQIIEEIVKLISEPRFKRYEGEKGVIAFKNLFVIFLGLIKTAAYDPKKLRYYSPNGEELRNAVVDAICEPISQGYLDKNLQLLAKHGFIKYMTDNTIYCKFVDEYLQATRKVTIAEMESVL